MSEECLEDEGTRPGSGLGLPSTGIQESQLLQRWTEGAASRPARLAGYLLIPSCPMRKSPKSSLAQGQRQPTGHAASCLAQPFGLISVACLDAWRPCCLAWFLNCLFRLHLVAIISSILVLKEAPCSQEFQHRIYTCQSSLLSLYQKEPNTRFKNATGGGAHPSFHSSKGRQARCWPCLHVAEYCHQTPEPDTRGVEEALVSVKEKQPLTRSQSSKR